MLPVVSLRQNLEILKIFKVCLEIVAPPSRIRHQRHKDAVNTIQFELGHFYKYEVDTNFKDFIDAFVVIAELQWFFTDDKQR
jgi:hypothetical protein